MSTNAEVNYELRKEFEAWLQFFASNPTQAVLDAFGQHHYFRNSMDFSWRVVLDHLPVMGSDLERQLDAALLGILGSINELRPVQLKEAVYANLIRFRTGLCGLAREPKGFSSGFFCVEFKLQLEAILEEGGYAD